MKSIKTNIVFISMFLAFSGPAVVNAGEVQAAGNIHQIFDKLLRQYVKNGVVDYRAFKKKEKNLDQYLKIMEEVKPETLSHNDRFAFYINLYNAWTIKLILKGYPGIESIKDMGSFFKSPWKKKIVRLNSGVVTLDHIEHGILRPDFKDPRVHFAINCAARSCPPLRSEAYQGRILDAQLDDSTISFINDPGSNFLKGEDLHISKIFDWFEDDFHGVRGFFLKYAKGDLKKELIRLGKRVSISHLDYDWDLNGS